MDQLLVILALDRALPSALVGVKDMFTLADLSSEPLNHPNGELEMDASRQANHTVMSRSIPKLVSASINGQPITDGQGRFFKPDCALTDITHCQGVIIPGFVPCIDGLPPQKNLNSAAKKWLKDQYAQGALLGGSCSGVFVLGETGLLHSKHCTTTWWLHYELIHRYPGIKAIWGSSLVQSERLLTAGGPLSWIDICLRMIRTLVGAGIANRCADYAVIDSVPQPQERYIPQGHVMATSSFLISAEHAVRQQLKTPMTTQALASALAVSERTLSRRLNELTGESAKSLIDRVRMDIAKTLLTTREEQISTIATELGYNDSSVFRRLFKKQVGMTPSEYRHWHKARQ